MTSHFSDYEVWHTLSDSSIVSSPRSVRVVQVLTKITNCRRLRVSGQICRGQASRDRSTALRRPISRISRHTPFVRCARWRTARRDSAAAVDSVCRQRLGGSCHASEPTSDSVKGMATLPPSAHSHTWTLGPLRRSNSACRLSGVTVLTG
jgi:hypothetical protein